MAGDFAYLGAGAAEWAQWARAVIALRSIGKEDVFELRLAKRGGRAGWADEDGNKTTVKYAAQSKKTGQIFWTETGEPEKKKGGRPKSVDPDEVFGILSGGPLTWAEWKTRAEELFGVKERSFGRVRIQLLAEGRVVVTKDEKYTAASPSHAAAVAKIHTLPDLTKPPKAART